MNTTIDLLICGLGNPGAKYEKTRHNIGWMIADSLAENLKTDFLPASPIYWLAEKKYAGKALLISKPTTYMNNSGEAVRKLRDKYQLSNSQIIVVTDEYNFPVGKVHLKKGGSDGGHNGINSIISELESADFWRLRCGIGQAFAPGGLVDYVLSVYDDGQIPGRDLTITKAVAALIHILKSGAQRAMSDINSERLFGKEEPKKKQNRAADDASSLDE